MLTRIPGQENCEGKRQYLHTSSGEVYISFQARQNKKTQGNLTSPKGSFSRAKVKEIHLRCVKPPCQCSCYISFPFGEFLIGQKSLFLQKHNAAFNTAGS